MSSEINKSTIVIAEAGVNHNGDEGLAFDLIDAAVDSGADIVKFQTFKADSLVTKHAKKAEYQLENTDGNSSQIDMLRELELEDQTYERLNSYCKEKNIEFLSTAFDLSSLHYLVSELELKRLKIPSGEITNLPLILEFAKTGLPIIISSGMSSLKEIQLALGVLAFGYLKNSDKPSVDAFEESFLLDEGKELLKERVTLLHCLTEYPAPKDEINLNAIRSMKKLFGVNVGYSDHTEGTLASLVAVSLGANVIEKHFTLDRSMTGPDHKASLEPDQLTELIRSIKEVERMMGDGEKRIMPSEMKNALIARKSIVAAESINKGEIFTENNLTFKRPASGKSPSSYWDLLDQKAKKNYSKDDFI